MDYVSKVNTRRNEALFQISSFSFAWYVHAVQGFP